MLSIDTNIVFPASQSAAPLHDRARTWLESLSERNDVVLSELMLADVYGLLRNPVIQPRPLSAPAAATIIKAYRRHPRWRIVGFPPEGRRMHDALWEKAAEPGLAYRRFYDLRLAISLQHQGVDEFATINVKDFQSLGFRRVWNPLAEK
ncbi:MAG: VapC toxin family PIN domain ribonuclease [Opitutaceae bacterium]|nr:VapC toxin family PIN domain ribonuclease [Opitutaceae bacterium]